MNNNNHIQKGKPKNCHQMETTETIWAQNIQCLKLDKILNEGTHNFYYIPRQNEESNEQNKEKSKLLHKIAEGFGLPIHKKNPIVLFKKQIKDLMNEGCHELRSKFQEIIQKYNSLDLMDIYYQMNEEFVRDLIKIWEYKDEEEYLTSIWLQYSQSCQLKDSPLIVKNAYLNFIKKKELGPLIPFEQYVASHLAYQQVVDFLRRAQELLLQ